MKNMCTQGLRFNKFINLYCFFKDILKWNWPFFVNLTASLQQRRTQWTAGLVPLPWFRPRLQQLTTTRQTVNVHLTHHCLCNISANVNNEKGKCCLRIFMKIVLILRRPLAICEPQLKLTKLCYDPVNLVLYLLI